MKTETDLASKKISRKKAIKKTGASVGVSKRASQHVIPLGNGWVVKTGSSKTFTVITDNKKEAVEIAKSIAKTKKTDVIVHGKFGVIEKTEVFSP